MIMDFVGRHLASKSCAVICCGSSHYCSENYRCHYCSVKQCGWGVITKTVL